MSHSERKDERAKLLIVDDSKQNIELLMELFRDDYKIAVAKSGQRALKIALSEVPPDIILTDILMPEMDGYELCRNLKENSATKDIPLIFVTAISEEMDASRGFALGAVDYITKPFNPLMVKARVKLHLDLKRKQELLEKYAFIDALTEIPNRRRFDEVIAREWNRALRAGYSISLMIIDIDHFKLYNDTYGHGKGDNCLRMVAATLAEVMRRSSDFVARYGGEEFVVILPDSDLPKALETAKNIQDKIDALAIAHESSLVADHVTFSIGASTIIPEEGKYPRELIEAADSKLYEAKSSGRHCICS
ncbi:MAG: diguanylate cyclase [Deltaproteobacteria bacterium]|nr:diguanylate cyclase [Candidatus Tharpella aukensis]